MTLSNRITMMRVVAVPLMVAAWYALPQLPVVAAAIFLIAALSDIADGAVARKRGEITVFGKFMDPIADKLIVLAATLLLLEAKQMHIAAAMAFVLREVWVAGVRLVAVSAGEVVAASALGKAKTVTQMVAIIMLLLGNWPFSLLGFPMDVILLWLSVILCLWSGVDYTVKNMHGIRIMGSGGKGE